MIDLMIDLNILHRGQFLLGYRLSNLPVIRPVDIDAWPDAEYLERSDIREQLEIGYTALVFISVGNPAGC